MADAGGGTGDESPGGRHADGSGTGPGDAPEGGGTGNAGSGPAPGDEGGETSGGPFGALLKGGSVVFLGLVAQLGLNFLAKVVVARLLGRVDFGAVALGYTLLTTATVVTLVGTDTAVGRYLPRYDDAGRRRGVLVSAFQVVVPLAVVVGVAFALLADPVARVAFSDPALAPVLRVFGLAVPLAALVRLTVGTVRGMEEALPRVYLQNLALPLTRFGFVAGALAVGLGVVGVAWAYAVSYAVVAALAVVYLRRRTPLFEPVAPDTMHRELLGFAAPLLVTATTGVLFANVDTVLLGALTTTGDVGVYNVAYPLASLLVVVLSAFGFVFMPAISGLHADGDDSGLRRTYHVVSKWILVATLPAFLAFVTYPGVVIRTTFGGEYVAGAATLAVLSVGFLTHAVAGPSGNTLVATGHPKSVMYANVSVVVVNVALNLLLIPRLGILGAALATTVGYVLMNGLYLAQLYRLRGIHPFRPALVRPALAGVAVWAVLSVPVYGTDPSFVAVALQAAAFAPLYAVAVLRFGGIEREEVELLGQVEGKLGVELAGLRTVASRLTK